MLVWADEEGSQATPNQPMSTLNYPAPATPSGFHSRRPAVDVVSFAGKPTTSARAASRRHGRALSLHGSTSPGQPNQFATANQPPVLAPIGNRIASEGELIQFTAPPPTSTWASNSSLAWPEPQPMR